MIKFLKKTFTRKAIKWLALVIIIFTGFVFFTNKWIIDNTAEQQYIDLEKIPQNGVGLLLGTSKYNKFGGINLYFNYRIEAAVQLFRNGKIKHIIVSGDNRKIEYNEPREMRRALIKRGVPDSCITMDYAGFRTLDSVVRSKKVFGQSKITIISQKFHCERALFIANFHKIEAIAFCAEDVPENYSYYTQIREYLAKTKAVLDLYVFNIMPKFLGKEEKIKVE